MKKIYLLATAIVALASCTSDNFVGSEEEARLANGETPISFGFDVPAATRASGADAATALGNQFIVYGEKSETAATAPGAGNYVFPNYQVNYAANSAYTTTSNTKNWEYVGYTHSAEYRTSIKTKDGASDAENASDAAQTIKYWDYGATNYVFTAVSAQQSDITAGNVTIQKNTSGTTVFDKGYTVTLAAAADPTKLYFSDRQVIAPGTGADRTANNAYGGNVTFTFRNAMSQIRVGMYETIPGHTVTIDKFSYVDAAAPTFPTMTTAGTDKFYANVPNLLTTDGATLTVTYYGSGARLNQPKIAITDTPHNYIALGGADSEHTGLKANAVLATSSSAPTFNETSGAFTMVFPQEANDKTLKLKVDYTLTAPVTNETIHVYGATAEIPAEYLQWKPNFKYTYIFKVNDNTDGKTKLPDGVNPDSPEGLYPITFDAVSIEAENGEAEYITTVSEPSITTFGVNTSTNKYITGSNEYPASTDIYATVEDASVNPTLSATNMKLYTVTTSDATNFPITEASVAEALIEGPTLNAAQATAAKIKLPTSPALTYQNTVPAEDGTTINMDGTNNKAAKFTTAASTVYALVYEKTAATYTVDGGQTYANEAAFTAAGTLYKEAGCTNVADAAYYTENQAATYYKRTAVSNKGVYAIKIVRVAP